jgi:hypothetical protein
MITDLKMGEIEKPNHFAKTSPLIYARVAGLLYLLLVPLGFLGILSVPSTVIVPGNAATTTQNIIAFESGTRLSILAAFAVQIVNILVVLFLYKLFKPVNKDMASLMVIFLLVAVPITILNELNNLAILLLARGADNLKLFSTNQVQALVPLFLQLHASGIKIAGIFWGLWLFPMGYLVFKSGFLPRVLGILLMMGCFGYLVDSVTFFLFPNFGVTVSQFTFIGEILLPLWLLIKGVDVEQWKKRSLEST